MLVGLQHQRWAPLIGTGLCTIPLSDGDNKNTARFCPFCNPRASPRLLPSFPPSTVAPLQKAARQKAAAQRVAGRQLRVQLSPSIPSSPPHSPGTHLLRLLLLGPGCLGPLRPPQPQRRGRPGGGTGAGVKGAPGRGRPCPGGTRLLPGTAGPAAGAPPSRGAPGVVGAAEG